MDAGAVSGHDPGFAEHLTGEDLRLLRSAAGGMHDRGIEALLGDARVFGRPAAGFVTVSPFLAFAVGVHRAAADLTTTGYLPERSGLRQRVPLFDAPQLRDFLSSADRRLFLAELLASFTRVASGRYQVRSGGRTRSRRFSELDPVRLAGLPGAVPEESRPGVYRRLGDVSLFLADVFPDYCAAGAFGPAGTGRLLRLARVPAPDRGSIAAAPAIDLLEYLGARWYRAAVALAPVRTARLTAAGEVAERFRHSRRILNHLADRYLLSPDSPWFTALG